MGRIKVKLSENEVLQLEELLKEQRDRLVYRRLLCIKLLNSGKTNTAVSETLDVSLETIKNWLVIYRDGGFEDLVVLYDYEKASSMDCYSREILDFVTKNTISTIWEVVDYVNNELCVPIRYHAVRNFLKKNLISLSRSQNKYHLKGQRATCKKSLSTK